MTESESDLDQRLEAIASQADFVAFVRALLQDFGATPSAWENATLDRFLDAVAAWVEDMGDRLPDTPSWRTFGQILDAARLYE